MTPPEPEIIMFGGAFDPPHRGHSECVRAALETFKNSRIIVVPGKVPASFAGKGKDVTTDFDDRMHMATLAFKRIDPERVEISRIEGDLPSPNYTINTLRELGRIYPHRRLGLLIGHDNFAKFPRWQDPRQVFEIADVLVAGRADSIGAISLAETAAVVMSALGLAPKWNSEKTGASFTDCTHHLFLLPEVAHPAESQKLRATLAQWSDEWLDPEVRAFIEQNGFYRHEGY